MAARTSGETISSGGSATGGIRRSNTSHQPTHATSIQLYHHKQHKDCHPIQLTGPTTILRIRGQHGDGYSGTQTMIRMIASRTERRHTRRIWKATHPHVNEDALLVTNINVANPKPSGASKRGGWNLSQGKSRASKYLA